MRADQTLDCLGLLCPLPVLRAGKALRAMQPGAVLAVLTSDQMALIDLPHFCAEAGHDYLGASELAPSGAAALAGSCHLIRVGAGRGAA